MFLRLWPAFINIYAKAGRDFSSSAVLAVWLAVGVKRRLS